MPLPRRARDLKLLDALDRLPRISVDDVVWRALGNDRDPLLGQATGGRWDPSLFDVLHTSFDSDGAVSELYFHLSRQPVFPSKVRFSLNEIAAKTKSTIKFADVRELKPFGVEEEKYSGILYEKTQTIADAAAFLGFDGIIAPNARWQCLNLITFSDRISPEDLELRSSTLIDWDAWRLKHVVY